jgi:hypothetical protein
MTLNERISAFKQLSHCLQSTLDSSDSGNIALKQQIEKQQNYNPWFIPLFVKKAILAITQMLDGDNIDYWLSPYRDMLQAPQSSLRAGVIMAGNIPLVGFHDFISVLISGHAFTGKLSSNDAHLLPLIAEILCQIEPRFTDRITFCSDRLDPVDVIIATGSNNAARHFAYYFQQYPSIIRKHCNSIAILDGSESDEDLKGLADDIFLYFGLGCRSISKIYVPRNYSFDQLFAALDTYKEVVTQHNKYLNNLDYQKTLHLLNVVPFLDQGIVIFKQENSLASPIGVIHYQYYDNMDGVLKEILSFGDALQCIAGNAKRHASFVQWGETQFPKLTDYANGIDTLDFLNS